MEVVLLNPRDREEMTRGLIERALTLGFGVANSMNANSPLVIACPLVEGLEQGGDLGLNLFCLLYTSDAADE